MCVCARARACVRVRAILCACVFAMFCMKIFVNFTDAADRVETYGGGFGRQMREDKECPGLQ